MQPDALHPYAFLEDEAYTKRHGNQRSKRLWGLLRDISGKVASMIRLMTFSLWISPDPSYSIGFWLPRLIMATVIEALPETFVNLEIDTCGLDYFEPGSVHLCDAIRRTLPYLRNLRLRLRTLYPAIFGADFDPSGLTKFFSNFQPVAALSLQAVVIYCIPGAIHRARANICSTSQEALYNNYSRQNPEARNALIDSLLLGVERGYSPTAEPLRVIHSLPHNNHDASIYATVIRRDILENHILALPFRNVTGSQKDSFLVRTLEGQETFSYAWVIEALAEGRLSAPCHAVGNRIYDLCCQKSATSEHRGLESQPSLNTLYVVEERDRGQKSTFGCREEGGPYRCDTNKGEDTGGMA